MVDPLPEAVTTTGHRVPMRRNDLPEFQQKGGDRVYMEGDEIGGGKVLVTIQEITSITSKHKIFKCMECADELVAFLKSKGKQGEILDITTDSNSGMRGNIWSDTANQNISTNGRHRAVLYDGKVYDNIHKTGIDYDAWANDFYSPGNYNIDHTKF